MQTTRREQYILLVMSALILSAALIGAEIGSARAKSQCEDLLETSSQYLRSEPTSYLREDLPISYHLDVTDAMEKCS